MRHSTINVLAVFSVSLFLSGCAVVEQGTGILGDVGKISTRDAESIVKVSQTVRKTFADITEEEEYYIGRGVAALILARYPVYKNAKLTRYINSAGNAVAIHSERPEIYAGYHFWILDTEEVNALAAPGGFIFITKGLLQRCQNEEMLAAVLAHEVGHVCARHGLRSIKNSRLIDAFKIIGEEAAERYTPEKLAELAGLFEKALGDIAEQLIERGYDRKYEYEADRLGVSIAASTGYSPQGMLDFLETLQEETSGISEKGWFKTHPSAADRIERLKKTADKNVLLIETEPARSKRFTQHMKNLT